ncbi:SLATT domain-containing protein [Tardiphaga sp.]|uniref:SLATT domain-containing protein n=1 Tax=Tardiphaga sp. TaxID=1926292 RepID=UPI002633C701|nr:SLATT domain-containing protein [Tardiphaga sp.]
MTLDVNVITKIRNELSRMEEDCTHSGKAHFNANMRWTRWNYVFGVPSIVLSAAAGTAFFKDYASAAGMMATCVTVLTALMTFLKPSERASEHKNSGDQYLSLRNDARVFREIEIELIVEEPAAVAGMNSLTTRRNELNQASPQFSASDFQRAKAGVDAGEALHAVDRMLS